MTAGRTRAAEDLLLECGIKDFVIQACGLTKEEIDPTRRKPWNVN